MSSHPHLGQSKTAHHITHHITPVKTYRIIFILLGLLLFATVLASELPLSRSGHLIVAMTIAMIKAVLIVLFFMHVYYSAPLTWVIAAGSFLWVGLLLAFLTSDYISRGWLHNILGK
ncbi:cytochrome C oxidase subunit IV family protein [Paludisphaera rhizosphaerae]|uniref:cytochrome C oxidase subunit IV family protein n=1 Tax=Paludisphaera rhizosphaerae TaxID=2711216 RepID=UPI00197FE495|nr:cytochrome C oxidase subunit IV family protein [Paludisphaera rhizosphaerae]